MTRCTECDRYAHEVAMMADEIAFWKFHAMSQRACRLGHDIGHPLVWLAIEQEFKRTRIAENRKRRTQAEAWREIGS